MHLTAPGGSQSPEGQTGMRHTSEAVRDRLVSFLDRWDTRAAIPSYASYPAHHRGRGPLRPDPLDPAAAALPPGHPGSEPAGGRLSSQLQGSNSLATEIGIRELLEAGVHFGHQTRRWNPKMRRFIFGERGGIHIIDLQKTERLLHTAQEFAGDLAGPRRDDPVRGHQEAGPRLDQGSRQQPRHALHRPALAGRLLTNFQTINKRIRRLHDLRDWTESGTMDLLPVRERIAAINERDKLETNLGGVADMQRPDAVFVVDLKTEAIGVREAKRLKIPIIGLVDTNCDPIPWTS